MRLSTTLQAAFGSVSLLFSAQPVLADHGRGHRHAHDLYARKHTHHVGDIVGAPKVVRKATCSLPDDPDLVHIPGAVNNGFAMSPDEPCEDGKWCPIACKPGKVMAQWKPNTKFTYPESMYGGLFCNRGKLEQPFKQKPLCVDGTGAVKAVNKAGSVVSFCQTVLPGNEAMLIPTDVTDSATLAIPGPDYWAGTSAHYYVNAPGIDAKKGCIWGTKSEPIGNWSPFVAGGNTLDSGVTFAKIAWNPEWLRDLGKETPSYGLKIECPSGKCNGLPCVIDPSKTGIGGVESPNTSSVDGGGDFCVVTIPKGESANIVVFNTDGSSSKPEKPKESKKEEPTHPPPPPKPTTTAAKPTSAPANTPPPPPPTTTSKPAPVASSRAVAPSSSKTSTTSAFIGGIFVENRVIGETKTYPKAAAATEEAESSSNSSSSDNNDIVEEPVAAVKASPSNEGGAADHGGGAIAGLVVAIIAAAALY
ncbi:hypothetical protein QBC35DRAFT_252166 [Podospora australis]|uniref:Glycoside Hydrolase Family 61 n=1 Tax=Podospora australis TaxID=1536484 RepID=A0AAN6WV82_9PEZI|nr:hypothetical protein QBC35DRAFT_252166 [Podospora australis]